MEEICITRLARWRTSFSLPANLIRRISICYEGHEDWNIRSVVDVREGEVTMLLWPEQARSYAPPKGQRSFPTKRSFLVLNFCTSTPTLGVNQIIGSAGLGKFTRSCLDPSARTGCIELNRKDVILMEVVTASAGRTPVTNLIS